MTNQNKSAAHWGSRELTPEQVEEIVLITQECRGVVDGLISQGHIEEVLSEESILEQISEHVDRNGDSILEYLGKDGKILVPMDSAEKFADIMIQRLGINPDRVVKFKVSTYKNGESQKKELSDDSKDELAKRLDLNKGSRVLILEDLIDTGFTLGMLHDFIEGKGAQAKSICLFDKQVEAARDIKAKLGSSLESIINIGNEFIVGFGIDYQQRVCARKEGLWKVKEDSIDIVCDALNLFTQRIETVLNRNIAI